MTNTTTTRTEFSYEVSVPIYVTTYIHSGKELTKSEILQLAQEDGEWMSDFPYDEIDEVIADVITTSPQMIEIETCDF